MQLAVSFDLGQFHKELTAAARVAVLQTAQTALREESSRLRLEAAQQFATEGSHGGTPWARRKKPTPRPLLILTGNLLRSLTEEKNPAHIERLDVDERGNPYLVFGSSVSYSTFHQRGTRYMPQRELLTASMLGATIVEFP